MIPVSEVGPAGLDVPREEVLHQPQPSPLHHLHLVLRLEAQQGGAADTASQLGVAGQAGLSLWKIFQV